MALGLLEINDSDIRYFQGADLRAQSPGYAWITANQLTFGDSARAQAKLHPSAVEHQFWQQLSLDDLNTSANNIRHRADLAYHHLQHILAAAHDQPHVLAVPGSFSQQQLALLLGIIQSAALPVGGMIDSALLACQHIHQYNRWIHIDIQLHQTVISELVLDNTLQRRELEIIGATGLVHFFDHWAQGVTEQFIQQTRFNPLHKAETEQALHNQLLDWFAECNQPGNDGSARITLDNRDITLLAAPLLEKSARLYDRIRQRIEQRFASTEAIYCSDRFAALPGAMPALQNIAACHVIDASALPTNAEACASQLLAQPQDTIRFITRLTPATPLNSATVKIKTGARETASASHILVGHNAYRLKPQWHVQADGSLSNNADNNTLATIEYRDQRLALRCNGADITINNQPVKQTQTLSVGDTVGIGETPHQLLIISEH